MNPKIAPVLDEISAVLRKHDMAGLVLVANPTHVDWRMEISPTWSCAKCEHMPDGQFELRMRSRRADYPDAAAQKKCLEATIGTFVTWCDAMDAIKEQLKRLLVIVSRDIDFLGKSTREDG